MSKLFYAKHKQTGELWNGDTELMLDSDGFLHTVEFVPYENSIIEPLNPNVWEVVYSFKPEGDSVE